MKGSASARRQEETQLKAMISPEIRTALLNGFPATLVDELLECYTEQRRNLLLGNLRPNEVEGGRFAEAAFRMLEHSAQLG